MRGPGIQQFADEPDAVTLFKYAHGTDVIFGLLEKNAEQKQAFDDYMATRRVGDMPQWFEIYPVADKLGDLRQEPDATLIVDVGGGPGQELVRFKQKHSEIPGRFVLQDLPLTLKRIEKMPDGIETMEYDFFTPQSVKGMTLALHFPHGIPWHKEDEADHNPEIKARDCTSFATCYTTGLISRVPRSCLELSRQWIPSIQHF